MFATLVIVTHAYPLTGQPEIDLLSQLTDHQTHFSTLAVKGFFCISGYLIFKSLCRSQSLVSFFNKRICRIYPALIACNLLCGFVLGYFISQLSFSEYYASKEPWIYVIGNTQLAIAKYICLSIYHFVKGRSNQRIILLSTLVVLFGLRIFAFDLFIKNMYIIPYTFYSFKDLTDLGLSFNMGALLANINIEKLPLSKVQWNTAILIGFVTLVLIFVLHIYSYLQYIIVPLLTICIGTRNSRISTWYESLQLGDLSYGVYLWGFPIQQTLVSFGITEPIQLMIFAIPISYLMGYLSWNLVEKRFLPTRKKTV